MKRNWLKTGLALLMTAVLCFGGFGAAALADGETSVTFYMNDGTGDIYLTTTYTDGGRITQPEDPTPNPAAAAAAPAASGEVTEAASGEVTEAADAASGEVTEAASGEAAAAVSGGEAVMFGGWYADAECTTEYNFVERHNGPQEIYAKWVSEYYFEAEFTQLIDREIDGSTDGIGNLYGSGYSNEPKGLQLVVSDEARDAGSHNGYYLHDLYRNGLHIEFVITSDRDVEDATLTLWLAGEYYDCTVTDQNFYVSVRPAGADPWDEEITTYFEFEPIEFTMEMSGDYGAFTQFAAYEITTQMPLVKGENVVRLEIANTEHHGAGGTVNATAPMIDCISIVTNAVLTWEPIESNIE